MFREIKENFVRIIILIFLQEMGILCLHASLCRLVFQMSDLCTIYEEDTTKLTPAEVRVASVDPMDGIVSRGRQMLSFKSVAVWFGIHSVS